MKKSTPVEWFTANLLYHMDGTGKISEDDILYFAEIALQKEIEFVYDHFKKWQRDMNKNLNAGTGETEQQ